MRPLEEESLSEQTDSKTDNQKEEAGGDKNSCDKEKWWVHITGIHLCCIHGFNGHLYPLNQRWVWC